MSLARTRPPVRPTVRLHPVPPLDPPFDDEFVPEIWIGGPRSPDAPAGRPDPTRPAGSDRCRPGRTGWSGADPAPSVPSADQAGAPVVRRNPPAPTGPDHPATTAKSVAMPAATVFAGATPEAKQAAKRFLDTCLEIVNGYRPAGHVRALASPADAAGMVEHLASAASRLSGRRRPGQPVRTIRLRRLRVCEPRPGVVEAAAAVGIAGRTWAIAFRIERRRGNWVGISVALL